MISRDNIQDIYPLTPFQEGVLFHDLMDQSAEAGGDTQRAYFQQLTFRIKGPLDLGLFQKCWDRLIARHDILRTVFRIGGADRPVQIVLKRRDFVLETRDLSAQSGPERDAAVAAFVTEQRSRPFDLSLDPLMRVGCLVSDSDETIVVWSFHHILLDGWCIGILQRELSESYA